MAYTTIKKPSEYFNTKLYTGTGSQLAVTGVGFQPDFVWFKNRGTTNSHGLQDVVRGFNTTGIQSSNGSDADPSFDGSTLGYVSAVGSDGFTVEAGGCANASGNNYVSWNWLASNTTASNTDGSITSTVSANTTSGFSIVSYTGTGSVATVGHGLNAVPKAIFFKKTNGAQGWGVYHDSVGNTGALSLNTNEATDTTSNYFNNTSPTSSVFTVNINNSVNNSGGTIIAYCFAEVKGFSKFGSYTGNGNADGTFVYTGFKPAFLIVKGATNTGHWQIVDNKRPGYNPNSNYLRANQSNAESTDIPFDILSNGFKARSTDTSYNGSGVTYIYMAFAEEPLVGDNPATAR